MKKSRFTESQIVGILKEGEAGVPVAERRKQWAFVSLLLVALAGFKLSNYCDVATDAGTAVSTVA